MPGPNIHATAQVSASARLGADISIGPFAVVEENVRVGENCVVGAHAVIHERVRLGNNNHIFPHAVIGGLPQDLSFDSNTETFVEIGDNNIIREGVTINRATQPNFATRVGSGCFLMNHSHIAHDCVVGDNNIFATGATLGGHVRVENGVFFGGGVMVHQFCRIGSMAIIRGTTGVSMDVIPYTLVGGVPARHYRLNSVGLRRAGLDKQRLKLVSEAFRRLRNRKLIDDLGQSPEILHLLEWFAEKSVRGIHGFAAGGSSRKE